MQQSKINLWVGLFVLMGAAVLVALTLVVGGKGQWQNAASYQVSANFAGIGSLKVNAPVKMLGVEIGTVRKIVLLDDQGVYKAKVVMDIDQEIKLPADSAAMIYTSGLLGAQFISINQGVDAANLLKEGSVITQTEQAMQLEELIKNFGVKQAEADGK